MCFVMVGLKSLLSYLLLNSHDRLVIALFKKACTENSVDGK